MPFPISKLSAHKRQELFRDLNYLNTGEIKSFCRRHAIPYTIAYETKDGDRKTSADTDRKGAMLRRVRRFLSTGAVLPQTYYRSTVVCFGAFPKKLNAADKLFYGQYEKSNRDLSTLLDDLTGGRFKDGAIARMLARTFWSRGYAPTFSEYASAWLRASERHIRPNPEWAFLADRTRKTAGADWKKMRLRKAKKVIAILNKIPAKRNTTINPKNKGAGKPGPNSSKTHPKRD